MHKWSVGKKLYIGLGGLVFCLITLGVISMLAVDNSRDELNYMSSNIMRKSELAGSIEGAAKTVRSEGSDLVLYAALRHPKDIEKARDIAETALSQLETSISEIRPLLVDPRAKADLDGIVTAEPVWKESVRKTVAFAMEGKTKDADAARMVTTDQANLIDHNASDLRAAQKEMADAKVVEANQHVAFNRWTITAVSTVGIIVGIFILFMVRNMVAMLRSTVKELATGGEQVASASEQIAFTSQSLSQGASEQAASIEEISASMEEMTAMTRRNADNSSEATAMMTETVKQVERSNSALSDMVASMSSIKVSSEKVAKINKTIDEIAFQTNILALNAAVEAARAGQAGMGFAVVADEVRNLAQRSAVAAKDTAALIEESIVSTSQGTARLDLVSVAIRGITDSAGKVKNLLDEVNESSKQQGRGIQHVSAAISQVSTVTQTAAASAEESAAASEELSAQSLTVRDLVGSLAMMLEGESQSRRPEARRSNRPGIKRASAPRIHFASPEGDDPFPMDSVETGSFREF